MAHTCLCFGFLAQITYTLPLRFTTLHPSHISFTDDRTFIPLACRASPGTEMPFCVWWWGRTCLCCCTSGFDVMRGLMAANSLVRSCSAEASDRNIVRGEMRTKRQKVDGGLWRFCSKNLTKIFNHVAMDGGFGLRRK